jgi:Domain of unknown function (DUF4407)
MFDRALYQSDWFYQGFLWQSPNQSGGAGSARRFLRITIRLAMSFGLAWVIALFLELAIFSDTITDKIKRDHVTVNQPVYQRIEQYQAELGAEIEARRKSLAVLEALYREDLATAPAMEVPEPAQLEDLAQQIKALDAQENALRADLRQIQESIKSYAADMNAEQLGQRVSAANSGRAGAGPRYQFARQQKEVYEAQRVAREAEIAELRVKRDDLRATQTRIAGDAANRRDQARSAMQSKRDALKAQVEQARAELKELEATRLSRVGDFQAKALAASDFQKPKDDPLSRMTAYQELKNDPRDGETITLFSWMTKFLIIFLEIVPVVAKLFFSPPSVYAMRIQAEVERERRRLLRAQELTIVRDVEGEGEAMSVSKSEPDSEPAEAALNAGLGQRMREIGASLRAARASAPPPAAALARESPDGSDVMDGDRQATEPGQPIVPPSRETAGGEPLLAPENARAEQAEWVLQAAHRRAMERFADEELARRAPHRPRGRRAAGALQDL